MMVEEPGIFYDSEARLFPETWCSVGYSSVGELEICSIVQEG